MSAFLFAAGVFILATVAVGLIRILRGRNDADRVMAAQLLGTGGVASLLLLGSIRVDSSVLDLALTLTLLSAFVSVAFFQSATDETSDKGDDKGQDR